MPDKTSETTSESTTASTTANPAPRYRCTACGNLTRFDVVISSRTRAFHHYSVGGELQVEDAQTLDHRVESVSCRWCESDAHVVEVS